MINNPAWKRVFIRQVFGLAATRITAVILALAAVGTLCAVGIDRLQQSIDDGSVVITIAGDTIGD